MFVGIRGASVFSDIAIDYVIIRTQSCDYSPPRIYVLLTWLLTYYPCPPTDAQIRRCRLSGYVIEFEEDLKNFVSWELVVIELVISNDFSERLNIKGFVYDLRYLSQSFSERVIINVSNSQPDSVDFSTLSKFRRSIMHIDLSKFLRCFWCSFVYIIDVKKVFTFFLFMARFFTFFNVFLFCQRFFLFLKTFIENTIWHHFRNNGNKSGLYDCFSLCPC